MRCLHPMRIRRILTAHARCRASRSIRRERRAACFGAAGRGIPARPRDRRATSILRIRRRSRRRPRNTRTTRPSKRACGVNCTSCSARAEEIGAIPQPALHGPHGVGPADPWIGGADADLALQPEQRQRGCGAGHRRHGGAGRPAACADAGLSRRHDARGLRVRTSHLRRHARRITRRCGWRWH